MRSGKSSASAGRRVEIKACVFDSPTGRHKDPGTKRRHGGEQRCNCLPKKAFPGYPSSGGATRVSGHLAVTMMREPVVRVANTDISGCDCGVVWGVIPRASTKPCSEGRKGTAKACRCAGPSRKTDDGQACYASPGGGGRRCWRRGAHLDRSVRYLGRLHGDAERQEGLFCVGEAVVIQDQSAESPARSRPTLSSRRVRPKKSSTKFRS